MSIRLESGVATSALNWIWLASIDFPSYIFKSFVSSLCAAFTVKPVPRHIHNVIIISKNIDFCINEFCFLSSNFMVFPLLFWCNSLRMPGRYNLGLKRIHVLQRPDRNYIPNFCLVFESSFLIKLLFDDWAKLYHVAFAWYFL